MRTATLFTLFVAQAAADRTFEVPVMYPKGYEMTGDDGESLLAVLQKAPLIAPCSAAQAFSVNARQFCEVARSACSTVPRSCILPHRLPRVSTDTGKTNSPYQSTVLFQEPRQIVLYNRTS